MGWGVSTSENVITKRQNYSHSTGFDTKSGLDTPVINEAGGRGQEAGGLEGWKVGGLEGQFRKLGFISRI
jgi:hypothetical protein